MFNLVGVNNNKEFGLNFCIVDTLDGSMEVLNESAVKSILLLKPNIFDNKITNLSIDKNNNLVYPIHLKFDDNDLEINSLDDYDGYDIYIDDFEDSEDSEDSEDFEDLTDDYNTDIDDLSDEVLSEFV